MSEQAPLKFIFYIASPIENVWEGFVGQEPNRTIFMGAELVLDLKPGGAIQWVGVDKEGKRAVYVHGKVLEADAPKHLQYSFAIGPSEHFSRVTIDLSQETEATKVTVTHDQWTSDNGGYANSADGWPRILSRLKTLLETGKTFRPH